MFKLYRFSPIKNEKELLKVVESLHFSCFKLCKQALGHYLLVAGNVGIFCHYDDEYKNLVIIREKLTKRSGDLNQKYFELHSPIVIPARDGVSETRYTHLYIRKPDPYRAQAGDIDFILEADKYASLKKSLQEGAKMKGARVFDRPELDMIELYDPDIDALGYISTKQMTVEVRKKINLSKENNESIVLFGDSLLGRFGRTLTDELENKVKGAKVYNCATGGWNTEHGVEHVSLMAKLEPDYVVLSFGANDVAPWKKQVSKKDFENNYETIVKSFPKSKVVIFPCPPANDQGDIEIKEFNRLLVQYNETLDGIARRCNAILLDSKVIFGELLKQGHDYHMGDGIHLDEKGYDILINELTSLINKEFAAKGKVE